MDLASLRTDAKRYIRETGMIDGFQACSVRNMGIAQTQRQKSKSCSVVEPLISLVLQGSKTAQFGTQHVHYAAGDLVVIGQSLPMISAVINATPETPYVAVYVGIDLQILRSVYSDMGGSAKGEPSTALEYGTAETEIVDAISRMFRLNWDPIEEQTLGAAALREVYFRVLRSKYCGVLLQMILADSKANQVAKAITHIRREYRNTIKSEDLASIAGMSASVFYETFKKITASSPLQYQKDLRLLDAHQMLQHANSHVAEVAHAVGYESAAQFSREFSRKFGAPPKAFLGSIST